MLVSDCTAPARSAGAQKGRVMAIVVNEKGSGTSGNYGHAGIPGHRGGSAASGQAPDQGKMPMDENAKGILMTAKERLEHLDVAMTMDYASRIARFEGSKEIKGEHLAEAIGHAEGERKGEYEGINTIRPEALFDSRSSGLELAERMKDVGITQGIDKQVPQIRDRIRAGIDKMDQEAKDMLRLSIRSYEQGWSARSQSHLDKEALGRVGDVVKRAEKEALDQGRKRIDVTDVSLAISDIYREKGGPGSGFFGHFGIPGHQGGSSNDAVTNDNLPRQDKYDVSRLDPKQQKKYFEIRNEGHVHEWAMAIAEGQQPSSYALFGELNRVIKGGPGSGNWGHMGREGQRGGSEPTVQASELHPDEKSEYDQLDDLSKIDYLAHRSAGMDHDVAIALAEPDVAYAGRIRKGGPGSGYHGHGGRPGERGGSAPAEGGAVGRPVRNEQMPRTADTIKQIMEDTKASQEMAERFDRALDEYTANGYMYIRKIQTGEEKLEDDPKPGSMSERWANAAKDIETYIEKAPAYEATAYRGIQMEAATVMENMKEGDIIDMKGTSSWSADERTARGYGKVVFEGKGFQAATAIGHVSGYENEKEVLVSANQRFRIDKIEKVAPLGPRLASRENILGAEATQRYFPERYSAIKIHVTPIMAKEKRWTKAEAGERQPEQGRFVQGTIEGAEDRGAMRRESDRNMTITRNGKVVYDYQSPKEKGGPGSGYHGHEGRPGERGGSAPESGAQAGGQGEPDLSSVKAIEAHIEAKSREYGSRNEYLASDEYKALYPKVEAVYAENKRQIVIQAVDRMTKAGVKEGDRVEALAQGLAGGVPVQGKLFMKAGIPHVRLDHPQMTPNGIRKEVAWHPGWRPAKQ